MKRFVSMLLALCLAISLAAPAWAEAVLEEAPLTHEAPPEIGAPEDLALNKGEDPLSGSCGASENDQITWTLSTDEEAENAYILTIVGTGAMKDFKGIGSWSKADTPWEAYRGSITKLIVGEGITHLGDFAFTNCINMEFDLTHFINEQAGTVGAHCFDNCSRVTGENLYINFNTTRSDFAGTAISGTLRFGPNVTEIGYAAGGTTNLNEGGGYIFSGCKKITKIDLSEATTLTYIAARSFQSMTGLTEIVWPDNFIFALDEGASAWADYIFSGNGKMQGSFNDFSIRITKINTDGLFSGCKEMTGNINFTDDTVLVANDAFRNCGATSVKFPEAVVQIGASAFQGCDKMIAVDATELADTVKWSASRNIKNQFYGLANGSVIYCGTQTLASTLKGTADTSGTAQNCHYLNTKTAIAVTNGGVFPEGTVFSTGVLSMPRREDYAFDGWYTQNGIADGDWGTPVTNSLVPGTQIYYAKWITCDHAEKDYTAEDAMLFAVCGKCGKELGTAVLRAPENLTADGAPKAAIVEYSGDWLGGELSVTYMREGTKAEPIDPGIYTANIMAGGASASVTFMLAAPVPPVVPDTGLALDKTVLELAPGETAKLKASLTPNDATYKYIFWAADKTDVATVSDSGLVTAVSEGTAVITAKSWYGHEATCTVTVKRAETPPPADPWPTEGLEGFVTRCYRVALDRDPDKAGHADWVRWLSDGMVDASSCAYGFVFSKEMNDKHLSDEAFVKTLYRLFMDREGEPEGVNFWTDYLKAGHGREEVFGGFADSVEFARIKANFGIR